MIIKLKFAFLLLLDANGCLSVKNKMHQSKVHLHFQMVKVVILAKSYDVKLIIITYFETINTSFPTFISLIRSLGGKIAIK